MACLTAICLASSPALTTLAGLTWLLLLAAGVWLMVRGRRASEAPLAKATRAWLAACIIATLIWLLQCLIWSEPFFRYSGNMNSALRLLFMAAACHALGSRSPGMAVDTAKRLTGDALALACWCALLALAYTGFDRNETPTHAIPWSVINAMIAYLLLTEALNGALEPAHRAAWLVCAAVGLLTVLLSQTRSAYIVFPMAFWVIGKWWMRGIDPGVARRIVVGATLTLAALLTTLAWLPADLLKIRQAVDELRIAMVQRDYHSSMGARLALSRIGLDAALESPWIGIGALARIERISQAGSAAPSGEQPRWSYVRTFNHLHNQYLNNLVDGGLLGLTGLLVLAAGLWTAARRLRPSAPSASRQLGGLLLIHLAAGLTNVNFGHDYYPTMMGLLIGCTFVFALQTPSTRAEKR
jgi:O-antigen ligase